MQRIARLGKRTYMFPSTASSLLFPFILLVVAHYKIR
jgi:hypothetical protein